MTDAVAIDFGTSRTKPAYLDTRSVTVHQSQFGWDQYVLNAEKMPCRSELARESHGER